MSDVAVLDTGIVLRFVSGMLLEFGRVRDDEPLAAWLAETARELVRLRAACTNASLCRQIDAVSAATIASAGETGQ